MGRPSKRLERREEILQAFAKVLSDHGYAGATIAAVAARAGVAPGLVHHHFDDKQELLTALLRRLVSQFRERVRSRDGEEDQLATYADAALKLDERADLVAAKCWVGVLAEAIRDPALFAQVRALVDAEISSLEHRSKGTLSTKDAGCVLAFVIGSLVLGAFAPRKTAGFAAPGLRTLLAALQER